MRSEREGGDLFCETSKVADLALLLLNCNDVEIIINQFSMTSPQRVNSATTLQRGKAREESTSLFGGVEQEKSR